MQLDITRLDKCTAGTVRQITVLFDKSPKTVIVKTNYGKFSEEGPKQSIDS